MINSLHLYNTTFSPTTSSNNAAVEAVADQQLQQSPKVESSETITQENLYLSNRSQKINAISNEFFSGDSLDFTDVEALKERVYQLGLISHNEYAKLTNSTAEVENSSPSNENSTISLTNFLGNLLERLQNDDSEKDPDESTSAEGNESEALSALIKALESAKDIISNVEEAKRETDFKATLQDTLVLLKETIEAPTFEKIPLDDKVGLSKVYQTLTIVDQLSPQRLSNEKVNKYLDLSFG